MNVFFNLTEYFSRITNQIISQLGNDAADLDPKGGAASIESSQIEKWAHIDDESDSKATVLLSSSKRSKIKSSSGVGINGDGGVEHRKDREEWSDYAIECLLHAY
ncbi:hypothetical protein Droror1_Dr00003065 [Drosera rotundifolia]